MERVKWTDKLKIAVVLGRVVEGRIMLELINEVPGSNPGADQPNWGFFRGFPKSSRQNAGLDFHYHDPL